jgi:hypothetical protein
VDWNPEMRAILNRFEALLQAVGSGGNVTALAQQITDGISLSRLCADINGVFDSDVQFDRQKLGRPEAWPTFRPLLLSILADISFGNNRCLSRTSRS